MLRKILASSSFAIGDTLGTMIQRLEGLQPKPVAPAEANAVETLGSDLDHVDELAEEWPDEAAEQSPPPPPLTPDKVAAIAAEIEELKSYRNLGRVDSEQR